MVNRATISVLLLLMKVRKFSFTSEMGLELVKGRAEGT